MTPIQRTLSLSLAITTLLFADSPYLWIGTFAINDYSDPNVKNKVPGDLQFATQSAVNFLASVDHTMGQIGYSKYTQNLICLDQKATVDIFYDQYANACEPLNGSGKERSLSDFIYFAGHGGAGVLYMSDGELNLSQFPIDYNGWNKWLYVDGCNFFLHDPGDEQTMKQSLDSVFQGVQAVLGYGGFVSDAAFPSTLGSTFWDYWASPYFPQEPLWNAFFNNAIQQFPIHTNVRVGCLSDAANDFCAKTFDQTSEEYGRGSPGVYYEAELWGDSYQGWYEW